MKPLRCATLFLAAVAAASSIPAIAYGAEAPVFTDRSGLAIRGFDPVAYFDEGRPVSGAELHEHRWRGAVWRFATEAHRDAFAADPERFAPQYGGYCAYAMSLGKKAPIDPEAWDVVDGRLYLNKSPGVREDWLRDRDSRIRRADKHWAQLLEEE